MLKPVYCKFNMDTACVDAIFPDGTMISIYCPGVEDEVANSVQQRTELMRLMYNAPEEYVDLVLNRNDDSYL